MLPKAKKLRRSGLVKGFILSVLLMGGLALADPGGSTDPGGGFTAPIFRLPF